MFTLCLFGKSLQGGIGVDDFLDGPAEDIKGDFRGEVLIGKDESCFSFVEMIEDASRSKAPISLTIGVKLLFSIGAKLKETIDCLGISELILSERLE